MGPNDSKPEDVLEKTYEGEDFLRIKAEFDEYIRMKEEKEDLLVFKDWINIWYLTKLFTLQSYEIRVFSNFIDWN